MTPQLRFPEFTDEWQMKKLGDIASFIKDGTHGTHPDDPRGEYYLLSAKNLQHGTIEIDDSDRKISQIEYDSITKKYALKTSDILLSIVGTIGRVSQIPEKYLGNTAYQRSVAFLRFGGENSTFIAQLFNGRKFQNELRRRQVVSAQPGIYLGDIAKIQINLPSKPEQEKIADFLTAVDERIAVGEKKLELLETYKRGVMQKIFSQQIRFKDENGSPYPDWEEKKAGALFRNISNRKHNGELPVLSITQDDGVVQRDSLERKINQSDTGVKNYKIIEPNDFVISLRSFQGGIEMSNIFGISSPAYTVLRGNSEVIPGMFKHYFKRDEFISKLNSTVIGIRDGKQISYEPFSTIRLPVPYIEEQQKIADFLTTLDEKITAEKSRLTAVRQFKKALLQRMFV